VVDLGSTKREIVRAMDALPEDTLAVGGHPMCGKETSGVDAADPELYRGCRFVVVPTRRSTPEAVAWVRDLARALGANPVEMEAGRHDSLVAAISHLPYLVSAALMNTVDDLSRDDDAVLELAAGGFRDTSRLAASNVTMMLDILTTNRDAVLEVAEAYRKHLDALIDFDTLSRSSLRVAVDPMYGAGRGYLKRLLSEAGIEVEEIRGDLNPGFGGIHPEPIARHLGPLMEKVRSEGWNLGLANDGDADRIGAVSPDGEFVDPHKIMSIALRYLVERRQGNGSVVKTVSTTQMLNLLASRYGLPIHETPVGFNYIADHMLSDRVLIGGEESGGISIQGHVPEGDGILMGLLITEIVADAGAPLHEVLNSLMDDIGHFSYARNDIRTRPFAKKELVAMLLGEAPDRVAGIGVREINSMDGVKYIMEDDSWLLIRPSGTEPVLRIYAEARSPERVAELLRAGARLAHVEG